MSLATWSSEVSGLQQAGLAVMTSCAFRAMSTRCAICGPAPGTVVLAALSRDLRISTGKHSGIDAETGETRRPPSRRRFAGQLGLYEFVPGDLSDVLHLTEPTSALSRSASTETPAE